MRSPRWSSLSTWAGVLLGSAVLLYGPQLPAQNSQAAPRITVNIDESALTRLRGNVPHLARAEYDQGEAASATQLTHMRLVLSRSSEQQAALDQYLVALQDKSSSYYHQWLTPAEFGKQYGPADSDVAALVAWLESHGMTVEAISPGRTNIAFSGSVSQVEEAFHTSIHSFQARGRQFYSNTTDPQIPAALAGVIQGVAHLNTLKPRPYAAHRQLRDANSPAARGESANRPKANLTDTSNNYFYVVPADAATIYNTPNAFNANFSSGTSYTGAGVKIGIGGDATIDTSIVKAYRSAFLGDTTAPTIKYCNSTSSCSTSSTGIGTSDSDEAYIDTELAGALAPGATIYYYASSDLNTGIEAALNANVVDIFSLSFGECEQNMSTSDNAQINGWWEQAAAQGIAVTVASGDSGSADCDGDSTTATVAKSGLSVNGFASTPYNIAVGGTDFYGLESSFSSYIDSTTVGSSSTYYRTVLSSGLHSGYIPESVWNDSVSSDTTSLANNTPYTQANIVAAGGGRSSCSTNKSTDNKDGSVTAGSCTSGYGKPTWQTTGTTDYDTDGVRDIPDVSLMSGNGYDSAAWLICDGESGFNFNSAKVTLNCSDIPDGNFDGYGGTSTAAPAFAGILALVQQKTGSRLGQATQALYELYNGSHASAIFHDVTVGNNSVPCTSSTTDCTQNTAGYYFESKYDAAIGYDLASGMGSVDATELVNYWSTAIGSTAATVTVTASSSVTTAEDLSVAVTVSGSSKLEAAPSGTVTLSGGGYTSSAKSLSGGSYTFDIPAGSLATGSDTLTATYSGDAFYASATASTTVTVAESSSAATYSVTAASISSLMAGATTGNTSTVTISSTSGYAGTISLSCALTSYPSGAVNKPSCSISPTTVTLSGSTTSATATVTVATTAATSSALLDPFGHNRGRGLLGAGGGAVLALLLMFGIPAKRRRWQSRLGILVLMVTLGGLAGCGNSVSNSSSSSTSTSGTTAGTYTFTVTGTGNDASNTKVVATFTVTVKN